MGLGAGGTGHGDGIPVEELKTTEVGMLEGIAGEMDASVAGRLYSCETGAGVAAEVEEVLQSLMVVEEE
jgi:hypothetical protein